ncbi:hypothetical protein V6N13_004410 [Hibiscus sabdariffa]
MFARPLALNRSRILRKNGLQLVRNLPVLAFHAVALAVGRREEVCRTVSSFVMQRNAKLHIGSSSSMVCCRLVAMAIMGLSLASFWGNGYRLTVLTRPTHRPFCSG